MAPSGGTSKLINRIKSVMSSWIVPPNPPRVQLTVRVLEDIPRSARGVGTCAT